MAAKCMIEDMEPEEVFQKGKEMKVMSLTQNLGELIDMAVGRKDGRKHAVKDGYCPSHDGKNRGRRPRPDRHKRAWRQ